MPGNFSAVIRAYLASPQFNDLQPSTKGGWKRHLTVAEATLGPIPIEQVRPSIIQAYLDGLSDFPGKQTNARTALKALEKWALVRDHLPFPITTGTQTIGSDGGHEPWTDDEIRVAVAEANLELGRVVNMAINTGQRGSDIVKMRWSDLESQDGHHGINVTQKKTGKVLWIPLTSEFVQELETWEKRPPFFLILDAFGRPYTRERLSHDWTLERDTNPALKQHKLRGLVLHGLRASTVVRLRKMGFTDLEIASYIGMSPPMVARYSRLADQKKMAIATVERLENFRHENSKPLRNKSLKYNDPTV